MKKLLVVLCVSVMFFCSAGMANAILLDFTDGSWNAVDGEISKSFPDVIPGYLDVTLAATGGVMRLYETNVTTPAPDLANLYDGIGIKNDEVTEGDESLTVTFDPLAFLKKIWIYDLFSDETATFTWDSGSQTMTGNSDGWNTLAWNISPGTVDIVFTADDEEGFINDFAVAAIEVDPVPEPATMLLLGSGLMGLAGLGRKKFFKKG